MITAYCDHCGLEIPALIPAGCRVVVGKKEWSFHLCGEHQSEMLLELQAFVTVEGDDGPRWRDVK